MNKELECKELQEFAVFAGIALATVAVIGFVKLAEALNETQPHK